MCRVEWSREAVLALIEVYKNKPCLWNSKHISYKNREKNKEAVSEMTEAVKIYHPEVTDDDCRTKYQNLRGQFSKEYAKLLIAKEESGSDNLPKAKLWCFYNLLFLKDCIRPKTTKLEIFSKDSNFISDKNDENFDKNSSYKMDYLVDDERTHIDDDSSYKVEYLDHNYVEFEATEIETSEKRKLDEHVPHSEENARIKRSNPSQVEISSTDLQINMKRSNRPNLIRINKNAKIGELLTETLNECRNKEKRKWAQKEVLNIIINLIDVDSDVSE